MGDRDSGVQRVARVVQEQVAEVVARPLELAGVEERPRPQLQGLMLQIEDLRRHLGSGTPAFFNLVDDPSQEIDRLRLALGIFEQYFRFVELLRKAEQELVVLRESRSRKRKRQQEAQRPER